MSSQASKLDRYFRAVGRRKTATAEVRLSPGTGAVVINNRPVTSQHQKIIKPLELVGQQKDFNISAKVQGGGVSSQVEAIQLAIARAVITISPTYRQTLKKAGLLTRDPRAKERKKPGLKRARRAPQWQKR